MTPTNKKKMKVEEEERKAVKIIMRVSLSLILCL
tara:strand:+ start:1389 stop:1490 length:102 start_codon:yes stop_codon:yes gene_type:complete